MYYPFRREAELLEGYDDIEDAYYDKYKVLKPFESSDFIKQQEELRLAMNRLELKRQNDEKSETNKNLNPPQEEEIPREDLNNLIDNEIEILDTNFDPVDPNNLKSNISNLNQDQKHVFERFLTILENKNQDNRQLLQVIHGFGGTGKSFLAKCMIDRINLQFYEQNKPYQRYVIVAAPTGVTAKNINGKIHFIKIQNI